MCSAGAYGPLASLFLFLPLIVVPFDREEHACAQYENFERNEDYNEPVHLLNISRPLSIVRGITSKLQI